MKDLIIIDHSKELASIAAHEFAVAKTTADRGINIVRVEDNHTPLTLQVPKIEVVQFVPPSGKENRRMRRERERKNKRNYILIKPKTITNV